MRTCASFHGFMTTTEREVEKILLGFGGARVCWPFTGDPNDLERIALRGYLFQPNRKEKKLLRGCPNQCHENSPLLAKDNPGLEVWTGFALDSKEGVWRGHSWCVDPRRVPFFIETTSHSYLYFGARITQKIWKKRVPKGKDLELFMAGWAHKVELNRLIRGFTN